MKIELTNPWTLTVIPHKDARSLDTMNLTAADVAGLGVTVPASVPGNFELDLERAGIIPDPFFGTNILSLRDLEDRHLFYVTSFDAPDGYDPEAANTYIHFEGVDTVFSAFVNGQSIGGWEDMYVAFDLEAGPLKPTGNELLVHIWPTMIEAQEDWNYLPPAVGAFKWNYASLHMRKAPSSFGWDIMCRAVSGGLWRPVWLEVTKKPRLDDFFLYTYNVSAEHKWADLCLYYHFTTEDELCNGYEITVEGVCGGSHFEARQDAWHIYGNIQFHADNALLWYPKNAGDPNLYDVTVKLWRRGEVVDEKSIRFGIRTVELDRTSLIDADGKGEFRFLINHKPVFVMGSNWVPLDAFHSRDAGRLPTALRLLDEAGCNAVRCWGGNVYEDHAFFDYCDEHGIMVWQDFAMGCAQYPEDASIQSDLGEEVAFIVRKLRNHPSLCLWAGDNECDYFRLFCYPFTRNPADNILTRKIIPEVLRMEDFTRPYLPSSPFVDEEAFKARANRISEDHLWGPRDYFKGEFYRTACCHFASETGYHGCPAPATLRKYIPADELWPIFDQGDDTDPFKGTPRPSWLVHQTSMEPNEQNSFGYRIRLMTSQVRNMFVDVPHDLDTYAKMSQLSQAEAFKYFIERFRTAKWQKTGIIWWNVLDGWPQVSDAVVNYDFTPKLAYSFIQRAQKPVLMAFGDREDGLYALHAVNDSQTPVTLSYRVTDVTATGSKEGEALLCGRVTVPADGNVIAAKTDLSALEDHVLYVEWTDENGAHGESHYVAEPQHLDYAAYLGALHACGFDTFVGFGNGKDE